MPVGTSAAMAGVAAANAAIAQEAAHQARVERCKATIPNFDAQRATVSEMKEYAGCVDTLYPTELGADATIALKVLFVIGLAGGAFAAWKESREYTYSGMMAIAAMMGFIIAPVAVAALAALAYGIRWLFS